jgi:hypothetical protein
VDATLAGKHCGRQRQQRQKAAAAGTHRPDDSHVLSKGGTQVLPSVGKTDVCKGGKGHMAQAVAGQAGSEAACLGRGSSGGALGTQASSEFASQAPAQLTLARLLPKEAAGKDSDDAHIDKPASSTRDRGGSTMWL